MVILVSTSLAVHAFLIFGARLDQSRSILETKSDSNWLLFDRCFCHGCKTPVAVWCLPLNRSAASASWVIHFGIVHFLPKSNIFWVQQKANEERTFQIIPSICNSDIQYSVCFVASLTITSSCSRTVCGMWRIRLMAAFDSSLPMLYAEAKELTDSYAFGLAVCL